MVSSVKMEDVCAFCRSNHEKSTSQALEGVRLDMLGIVAPNFGVDVQGNNKSSESKNICFDCNENLKYLFDFKTVCLENEDHLLNFKNYETHDKINLANALQKTNFNEDVHCIDSDTDEICRLCFKRAKLEKTSALETVKNMLERCLPEIDLNLTTKTLFCDECLGMLEKHFKFLLQHDMKKELEESLIASEDVEMSTAPVDKSEISDTNTATESINDLLTNVQRQSDKLLNFCGMSTNEEPCSSSQVNEEPQNVVQTSQQNSTTAPSTWWRTCYFCDYSTTQSLERHLLKFHPELESKWRDLLKMEEEPKCIFSFQFEIKPNFSIKNENVYSSLSENIENVTATTSGIATVKTEETFGEITKETDSQNATREGIGVLKDEPNFAVSTGQDGHNQTSDNIDHFKNKKWTSSSDIFHNTELMPRGGSLIPLKSENGMPETEKNRENLSIVCPETPDENDSSLHTEPQKNVDSDEDSVWNKCPFCPYSSVLPVTAHIHNRHPDRAKFRCPHCQFQYSCKNEINEHITKFHEREKSQIVTRQPIMAIDKAFWCSICSFRTKIKQHLLNHIEEVHLLLKCPHCSKSIGKSSYKAHLTTHRVAEETWPECPICPYRAFSFASLKAHMINNKHGDSEYIEEILEKMLKTMSEKDRQAQKVKLPSVKLKVGESGTVRKKVCRDGGVEGQSTSKRSKKADGELLVPEKSWPLCSFCPIRLINNDSLSKHVKLAHASKIIPPKENWPKCPQCPYKTKNEASLRAHVRTCHQYVLPKFLCRLCGFNSLTQELLDNHIISKHPDKTPENTWPKCPHCPYRSKLPTSLKAHLLRHEKAK